MLAMGAIFCHQKVFVRYSAEKVICALIEPQRSKVHGHQIKPRQVRLLRTQGYVK